MTNRLWPAFGWLLLFSTTLFAQTTVFTYQGKLADNNGNPLTGNYDFQFKLFDSLTAGAQQGSTVTLSNITVTAGIFTVQLDVGACPTCFNGASRYLEIAVKPTSGSTYTTLGPRQQITSTPYAVKSLNAGSADGLSVACVNCVTSSQIASVNGSAVTGTIPVAGVPAGSANYIQNGTSQQATSNFNISGDGTAGGTLSGNVVNAATQFNLAGSRVLSAAGSNNLFAGAAAGSANTTGVDNSFFGFLTGNVNTTGGQNAFFGSQAGRLNTTGVGNAFFGFAAGRANTMGFNNAFFGTQAGTANTTGNFNDFFGTAAGINNTTGNLNLSFGFQAGLTNTTGSLNTIVGTNADVASGNLTNATAIGSRALVAQSNSLVLGSINGVNFATADTNVGIGTTTPAERLHVVGNALMSGTLSANIVNATTQYNIGGQRLLITSGLDNLIAGIGAGVANAGGFNTFFGSGTGINNTGDNNCFFGDAAGQNHTGGSNNTFLGEAAGLSNTTENSNSFIGAGANGAAGITNATAIGALAQVTQSNSLVLGAINGVNGCDPNFGVGCTSVNVGIGTTAPTFKLTVSDSSNTGLRVATATAGGTVASFGGNGAFEIDSPGNAGGRFRVAENGSTTVGISGVGGDLTVFGNTLLNTVTIANGATLNVLGAAGSTFLCRNASAQISTCSSSLRYKQNIHLFGSGLSLINRLRPVTFNWKANNEPDLGLVAEEVAKVEPLLVTHNDKGEVEGVKYDRINVVLINAIEEQQAQINRQHGQIKQQQQEIETLKQRQQEVGALKAIVCADHPTAAICKSR